MVGLFIFMCPLTSPFQQLSVRGKNKKEKLEDFFKNVVKSADGVLVAGVKVTNATPVQGFHLSCVLSLRFSSLVFLCFRTLMISLSTRRRFC